MRVMVIVKSTPEIEAGQVVTETDLAAMGAYNEELIQAGIMLNGEGLVPSKEGVRVRFSGDKRSTVDGPFTESKELVAGFWIWQVNSMEEAVEWAKKCPNPTGGESELEIRRVAEMDDFGEEMTPELRAQEDDQRARLESKQG